MHETLVFSLTDRQRANFGSNNESDLFKETGEQRVVFASSKATKACSEFSSQIPKDEDFSSISHVCKNEC